MCRESWRDCVLRIFNCCSRCVHRSSTYDKVSEKKRSGCLSPTHPFSYSILSWLFCLPLAPPFFALACSWPPLFCAPLLLILWTSPTSFNPPIGLFDTVCNYHEGKKEWGKKAAPSQDVKECFQLKASVMTAKALSTAAPALCWHRCPRFAFMSLLMMSSLLEPVTTQHFAAGWWPHGRDPSDFYSPVSRTAKAVIWSFRAIWGSSLVIGMDGGGTTDSLEDLVSCSRAKYEAQLMSRLKRSVEPFAKSTLIICAIMFSMVQWDTERERERERAEPRERERERSPDRWVSHIFFRSLLFSRNVENMLIKTNFPFKYTFLANPHWSATISRQATCPVTRSFHQKTVNEKDRKKVLGIIEPWLLTRTHFSGAGKKRLHRDQRIWSLHMCVMSVTVFDHRTPDFWPRSRWTPDYEVRQHFRALSFSWKFGPDTKHLWHLGTFLVGETRNVNNDWS